MKRNLSKKVTTTIILLGISIGCSKSTTTSHPGNSSALICPAHLLKKNQGNYLALPLKSDSAPTVPLFGHVPGSNIFSSDLGKSSDRENLNISIALKYRNEADLDSELSELYDPQSPIFHKFLSTAEFQARFAPSQAQVDQVRTYLVTHGLIVSERQPSGLLLEAKGSAQAIENLFHTEIHRFRDPKTHQIYTSPTYELQAPAGLPIAAVLGLDQRRIARHHSIMIANTEQSHGRKFGITPQEIKKAYSLDSTLDGSGQTLGLVELDTYRESDIRSYEKQFGLGTVPLENVGVGQIPDTPGEGAPEVTLDIELMIALAPRAQKILVYEAPNSAQGIIGVYNRIAQDHQASVISTSWGMSEIDTPSSLLETENAIFKQIAAQGQAFFAASGDSGAYDQSSQIAVDDPASQPYVVGVGGTQLSRNTDGTYAAEATWNDPAKGAGGGGGVSAVWSQPQWQKSAVSTDSKGSSQFRNVPDVSLNSDPRNGYAILVDGKWHVAGGTSCAAPLWAAFTSLVNQNRQKLGLTQLGFPLPVLYAIGQSNLYSTTFHDIADGSTNFYYPAVANYDEATGWGSFKGLPLIDALSLKALPQPPLPSPTQIPNPASNPTNSGSMTSNPATGCI